MSGKTTNTKRRMHRRALAALVVVLGAVLISAAPARADHGGFWGGSTSSLASRCRQCRYSRRHWRTTPRIPSCITALRRTRGRPTTTAGGTATAGPTGTGVITATSATDMSAMTAGATGTTTETSR